MPPSWFYSYLAVLLNFILSDILGGFDVDKVLPHLLQLGGFHKKLSKK